MITINADSLSDGLYNVKDGHIFKYKARGGLALTYEIMSERLIDIYVRDKDRGIIRRVGDDQHDQLTINSNGQLQYYNLQNGCGCRTGEPGESYEFVPNEDLWGYNMDPREEDYE